ncbi:MAG: Asp-tRNA(Asn)/Glu-tRNA(Gln) amidotransferase subunit GatA [Firmicutes bacterium]|nr:Asp-tRNA(Asn)/Glu-tRNA(Gln) amidotransferase subunit GatA [Bacillota bacterium]
MPMTALDLSQQIKEGKFTAIEATKSVLNQIKAAEKSINAYITVCEETALNRAVEIQQKLEAGDKTLLASPLAGVPMAIKDNICTKGIKTSCASKILGDFQPFYNGTVIERLKAAGVVIIGKTNMDEFAMGSTTETSYYGETKNPWDLGRVPGGSSGGSAAAVAAGEAVCALGSDTGGSIRQPAAYCGVTGLKPTYGMVSRYGLIAYASSLDQIGPIGRRVEDCAAIMEVISGWDELDGTSLPDIKSKGSFLQAVGCKADGSREKDFSGELRGIRIGIPETTLKKGVDEDVREALFTMAEQLKTQGAELCPVSMDFLDYVLPAYYIIAAAEASSNLSRFDGVRYGYRATEYEDLTQMYERTRGQGFGREVKKRILLGTFALSAGYYDAYYKKALQAKAVIKEAFDRLFQGCDCLLLPAAPSTAPKLGESLTDPLKMYLSDIFTVSANLAGLPALSLPSGFDRQGMPIGTQIIGPALGDRLVLKVGHSFQKITDYHQKSPGIKEDKQAQGKGEQ